MALQHAGIDYRAHGRGSEASCGVGGHFRIVTLCLT